MKNTIVQFSDTLPLTCSRSGTCCHGNLVHLNPWEFMNLARAKKMPRDVFRDSYTLAGGSVLHFNGKPNRFGKASCALYEEGKGCSVHPSRPLACRMFPLGRQIRNQTIEYIHEGTEFPCLKECPEVLELPNLTVEEYLLEQQTQEYETAQDGYLELMQNLADSSFELLLDTGLAESGDRDTLASWRKYGEMEVASLITQIPSEWMAVLMLPDMDEGRESSSDFIQVHTDCLNRKIQATVQKLASLEAIREASQLLMAMALFLAQSIGADSKELSEHWIDIAKSHGAQE